MTTSLDATNIGLFLLAVFPGLVSTSIYRLIMPARSLDWGSAVLQGVFYSAINFVLGLPILFALVFGFDPLSHPVRYCVAAILVLVVTPVVWPIVLVTLFKSKPIASRVQLPYPTAWDFFFDEPDLVFLLVHLVGGERLGGFFGDNSYAGTFPNDGDIYLEALYEVDTAGTFGSRIPNTRGVLLRKDQYTYIEVLDLTVIGGTDHGG